jgi:hypothetical protein
VLFVLGMLDRLADVADPRHDALGLELEEQHLPERIRLSRQPKPARAERPTPTPSPARPPSQGER